MATFDRPHVQQGLTTPLRMFKNTSRLQCVIPNSPPLEASPSLSTTPVINMDVRSSTPEPPVSMVLAPPPSPTDPNQSNIDHITSLERSLCSDFVCCGAHLPDLHALLEHFEEDHIMVLAPNGKRIYPPEGLRSVPLHPLPISLTTTPSSSRSSSVLSSPNSPSCPLSPSSPDPSALSDLPSRLHGSFERRKSSIVVAPVYTPFTPSLPIDPAYPYPDSTEIDMPLYDFSQDFYPSYPVQLPVSHLDNNGNDHEDEDEDMSDDVKSATGDPTSPIPTYVYGPDKSHPIAQIPKTVRGHHHHTTTGRHSTLGALKMSNLASSKSSKAKNRQAYPSSSSSIRRREKAYRCPTPRCTKSYLNPNGLKYHLEKGTCKIESDYESETGEESNSSSSLLPAAPITSTCPPLTRTLPQKEHDNNVDTPLNRSETQQQPRPSSSFSPSLDHAIPGATAGYGSGHAHAAAPQHHYDQHGVRDEQREEEQEQQQQGPSSSVSDLSFVKHSRSRQYHSYHADYAHPVVHRPPAPCSVTGQVPTSSTPRDQDTQMTLPSLL